MYIKEIQKFEENRYKARAYMSYILTRNLPDKLPQIELSSIKVALDKLAHEIEGFEALYILDNSGKQIDNNISTRKDFCTGKGEDRSGVIFTALLSSNAVFWVILIRQALTMSFV